MLRLQSVMRPSIAIVRTTLPAYSTTWPRPPAMPSAAMILSATSLAVTCAPSAPSSVMRIDFGRFIAITCVARMCASSVVPQPNARAPSPPTVEAWLSGTAWVAPGSTMPSSGPTTCEMPCSGSPRSNTRMPFFAEPSRMARRNAAPDGLLSSVRPGLVETVWSCIENVRSGRGTRAALLGELAERVRRVQLMQHVAVDVEQLAAVHAARHEMGVPDFLEQGFRHGWNLPLGSRASLVVVG